MHRLARVIPRSPLGFARLAVEVALVLVIAVGLTGVVLGRVLPATGHPVFVVAGPSMTPTIALGSAVVLEQVPASELRVGDVVSLRSGTEQAVFTHRIIRLAERDGAPWIETRGDANAAPDPSITPATAVIGRVTTSLPWAGYLLALLSTPQGVVLMLSVGATLMVLAEILGSIDDDRRRRSRGGIVATTTVATPSSAPTAVPGAKRGAVMAASSPAADAVIAAIAGGEAPATTPATTMAGTSSTRTTRRPARLRTDAGIAAERRRLTRARIAGHGS